MAKKKKSKKDLSNAYPYFLINSTGKITYVDEKGELADGGYLPAKNNKLALGGNALGEETIYNNQRNPQSTLGGNTLENEPNWIANMGNIAADSGGPPSEGGGSSKKPRDPEAQQRLNSAMSGIQGGTNILGNYIDDGTHIAEDRSMTKNKAIGSGIVKGAGTGAQLGATVAGPWGALFGGVIGGTTGGITGASRKNKEISEYKDYMAEQNSLREIPTTQYLAAYGGDLNLLANGGGVDPEEKTVEQVLKAERLKKQQYAESLYLQGKDPSKSLYTTKKVFPGDPEYKQHWDSSKYEGIEGDVMANYQPDFMYVDPDKPNFSFPHFSKPYEVPEVNISNEIPSLQPKVNRPTTAPLEDELNVSVPNANLQKEYNPVTKQYEPMSPQNKRDLDKANFTGKQIELQREYKDAVTGMDATGLQEFSYNTTKSATTKNNQSKEYLNTRTKFAEGGDLSQDTSLTGKPTEYNGNTHEEGGIDLGAAEVEDGEIRVGDYVFSDRLTTAKGKTFADEAKKITDQFEEYENDSAAKRTQNKQLEELKFQNDQAKLLKEKEEVEFEMTMQQDVMAYGGMIKKDSRGKYQIDKSNRKALMDAAKERKMSYNKYVDTIYKYGGDIKSGKKQYANGGGLIGEGTNPEISTDEPMTFTPRQGAESMFSLPELQLMQKAQDRSAGVNSLPIRSYDEVTRKAPAAVQGNNPYQVDNILPLFEGESTQTSQEKSKFGREETALIASQVPAVVNTFGSLIGGRSTTFDRLSLDPISMEQERNNIRNAMARAKQTHRQNVRGTATSAGDALAALSAGTAGLAGQEAKALATVDERERNVNTQLSNQEAMTNLNISNQEMVARQQDQAKRASVRNAALANMSDNVQGYLKDKSLNEENDSYNKKLMSLLETGEYKMIPDGDGGYMIQYKNPNKKDGTTVTETIKSEE